MILRTLAIVLALATSSYASEPPDQYIPPLTVSGDDEITHTPSIWWTPWAGFAMGGGTGGTLGIDVYGRVTERVRVGLSISGVSPGASSSTCVDSYTEKSSSKRKSSSKSRKGSKYPKCTQVRESNDDWDVRILAAGRWVLLERDVAPFVSGGIGLLYDGDTALTGELGGGVTGPMTSNLDWTLGGYWIGTQDRPYTGQIRFGVTWGR
jgi:hypothetical protein